MTWQDEARCIGISPQVFGGGAEGPGAKIQPQARAFCGDCPVRSQCLATALEEELGTSWQDRATLRGGLDPRERYALEAAKHSCAACGEYIKIGVKCYTCRGKETLDTLTGGECANGHPWSLENSRVDPKTLVRHCQDCNRQAKALYRERLEMAS